MPLCVLWGGRGVRVSVHMAREWTSEVTLCHPPRHSLLLFATAEATLADPQASGDSHSFTFRPHHRSSGVYSCTLPWLS